MGDDGSASCRLIRQRGGAVWVQTPADCTAPSMPDSVLATGSVENIGTPEELAASFIEYIQKLESETTAFEQYRRQHSVKLESYNVSNTTAPSIETTTVDSVTSLLLPVAEHAGITLGSVAEMAGLKAGR